jgi:hypothetical protein
MVATHGQVGDMGEAELGQRRDRAALLAAQQARPEFEIFRRRQSAFQRVGMAEKVQALLGRFAVAQALPHDFAVAERQEAGDRPQKAGFTRAVRPRHDQRLARFEREVHAGQQETPAAFQAQILGGQTHATFAGCAEPMRSTPSGGVACVAGIIYKRCD